MTDVLEYSQKFLKKSGCHPQGNSVLQKLASRFILSLGLLVFVLTLIGFVNINEGIVEFAKKFEALISMAHFYFKVMMIFYFKDDYISLFETTKKFWKLDNIPEDLKNKHQQLQKLAYIGLNMMLYFGLLTSIMLCSKPLLSNGELPWILYVPNKYFLNKFTLYLIESSFFFYITTFIVGHEFVYVGFCIHSINQFQLIKYILSNINFDVNSPEYDPQSCLEQIKKCVDHHNLLIKFLRRMGKVYSPLFLLQIVATVGAVCLELFASMECWKYNNKAQTIISLLFIVVLLIQLAMYCFPAAEVTAEAEEVGSAIYNSNWYEGDLTFRKHIHIIIRKGQETLQFSPGGMGAITRETFAAVIRTSYSIFTVINAAQGNNN